MGKKELFNNREREKSMEAQGTLSSFQTLLPEALMFSVHGLGGPMECSAHPLLCGSPPLVRRFLPGSRSKQVAKGVWVSVWP